jgi:hypothetical protein
MIVTSAPALQNLLAQLSSARLSSLLPVEVLVLKNLSEQKFLLQIKGQELEVSTPKPLIVGEKYLASLSHDTQNNTLFLKHFHKFPLKAEQAIYSLEEVFRHFKQPSKEAVTQLHSQLLSSLSNALGKEEFTFLTQLLLGLNQGFVSLPFRYTEGFGLLQYKKRKRQGKQSQDEVQFYAHLKHLGPIEGRVGLEDDEVYVHMSVLFEESLALLQGYADEFSFKSNLSIRLKEEISPLFALSDKILDINI